MADPQDHSPAPLTGAQSLIASLAGAGVDVCFMNPGTSELHFVHALDAVPGMRGVLTLFEGVAAGAADGYARMTGRPAAVLLHLGPGLGNALANLHNARRAHTPLLCVVGAHATGHVRYDAPLQSEITPVAASVSGWVHTAGQTRDLGADAMRAVAATNRDGGQVATLILPADVSWSPGGVVAPPPAIAVPDPVPAASVARAATRLRSGTQPVLLLGGPALTERGLRAASRIAAAAGVRLLAEAFPARLEAGGGLPAVSRVAYLPELADTQFAGAGELVLAGAAAPVTFFAYPGRSGDLVPDGCTVTRLAGVGQDVEAALEELAGQLVRAGLDPDPDAPGTAESALAGPFADEPLSVANLADVIAGTLPSQAIVVDEAITSGIALPGALARAARHCQLTLTGGAIGQGLPVATGAAIAEPGRPVLCVEADGSALYTIQALWTQAREQLDVTTVLVNNAAYAVLRLELARVGAGTPGGQAARMLSLDDPVSDFTAISAGLGVPASRVSTAAGLAEALALAYAEPGPHLIEAIVPPLA
jgi:acetolactate synthase-1/2/3 large subunit